MTDKLTDKEINDLLEAVSKEEYRDKDYSVLEGMQKDSVSKLRTAFDKGYKQGYETGVATQGFTDGYTKEEVERREKEAYQKGLVESWSLASAISCMDAKKQFEIFNESGDANVFGCHTAQGALDKLKEYEQKQSEIKVGDEVIYDGTGYRGIVTKIFKSDKMYYRCVRYDGDLSTENSDNPPTKTGRHFDQIEEVLEALKEG